MTEKYKIDAANTQIKFWRSDLSIYEERMNELKLRYEEMLAEKAAREEARKFQEDIEVLYRQQDKLWQKMSTFDQMMFQL